MAPIDTVLQKGHSSYQKYDLAKVVPDINRISQKWYLLRHQFLWVSYLSISGGVFVMCNFCEVQLFSIGI